MTAAAQFIVARPPLAFLEGLGAMEMMLVAVIGLLLFGGKGLPDMARTLGRVVREFKKATANVENEVKRVMDEEPEPAPRPRRKPRPLTSAPVTPITPAQSVPTAPASDPLPPPPAAPQSDTPPPSASDRPRA